MYRSYQLCLAGEGDVCTEFFSLEMNIPFVENREEKILEVDSVLEERSNIAFKVRSPLFLVWE